MPITVIPGLTRDPASFGTFPSEEAPLPAQAKPESDLPPAGGGD
jgi:hypothetical protein